jgi:cell division protein FtsQ
MSPIAAPADKRFRRAHVKPGRRRRDWKTIARPVVRYALATSVVAYVLYRATDIAAQSHALRIEKISVRGNERLSKGEVLSTLNGLVGESLIWTDLEVWRHRLLKTPWIRDAAMHRTLPSTVEVVVSERLPVAVGRIHGELYLIDEGGVIIDQYGPQYADFDLPIVDGLTVQSGGDGSTADPARAALAARVMAAINVKPRVGSRLSQVDVSDLHNVSVILNGDTAVIRLGEDQFLPRLESYLDLAAALHERVADIDYVDLRFDDRIYVRPRGTSHKPPPTSREPRAASRE